ncbi:MAG: YggS family pyridoxal phosphate-dependent enzyme [Pelotomaculum sp.]|uniref:Pyridoxal phosphate homeostasis protein n=1 Tax=Pelotomaculum thermopropionicum (strain DSM 13744 / JCM 10971 / SI) TaxID=370438 RepID=A5D187_PELTS|nr:YggS family pyridoxal phosphate-dependent enzyme [Pelotomaculum sp.]BAF60009.1 predicted enzyme [Pelotomaculum thermopropionicum SI]
MSVLENLNRVRRRIDAAAGRAGRNPEEIKLVAVTKTVAVETIREVLSGGVCCLGESRVQEFLQKYGQLPAGVEWHFIGHLQTNKVKKIIGKVSLIHSLDRWSLAEALSRAACEAGTAARVLVQVNIAGEKTKYGLLPSETPQFVAEAARLPGLEVMGLMTIAPWCENAEEVRPVFRQLKELAGKLTGLEGVKMDYLSMGMSGDFEVAVEEGANIVRVGSAIFGGRS